MEEKGTVKALEKGLIILDMIKESDQPLGVNEIARRSAINLTTAFRMLQTLKNKGWLYQDNDDKYIVGHKISFVTDKNNFYQQLKDIAYFTMSRLTNMEKQAMNLIVRVNEKCFILQQSRTDKVDYIPPIGSVISIYASAGGKILLSELSDFLLEEILGKIELKPLTEHTITDRTVLLNELVKIRQSGYAVDMHESQEEGVCVSVPVRSRSGEIIAALSFSGFIRKIPVNKIKYYFQVLKEASAEITGNIFGD
jgi:DNA-binding IclR family transcriptional regulator